MIPSLTSWWTTFLSIILCYSARILHRKSPSTQIFLRKYLVFNAVRKRELSSSFPAYLKNKIPHVRQQSTSHPSTSAGLHPINTNIPNNIILHMYANWVCLVFKNNNNNTWNQNKMGAGGEGRFVHLHPRPADKSWRLTGGTSGASEHSSVSPGPSVTTLPCIQGLSRLWRGPSTSSVPQRAVNFLYAL